MRLTTMPMRLTLAIAVAWLPEEGEPLLSRCLKLALEHADDPSRVNLLLYGNGINLSELQSLVPGPDAWASVRYLCHAENEGVPVALHRMWEACKELPDPDSMDRADFAERRVFVPWSEIIPGGPSDIGVFVVGAVPADQDIIVYLHDDAFIHSDGWDTEVLAAFEEIPNCWLAGFSGAVGLGLDGLYDRPYEITDLIRQDFISNLLNAEAHGRRVLERQRVAVNDGYSLIVRRSLLDAINGWEWWSFVHHNYDTAIAAQCARAGKEVWYIPVKSDHLSGYTANNVPGQKLLDEEGGEVNIHRASARALYHMFKDVLPLRSE